MTPKTKLTDRFDEAFLFAHRLHRNQVRKGSGIPYIAHLMSVAALVIEDGGDQDEAIATLLHDAVEDEGGHDTLDTIRRQFGDRVADIVDGCTDAYVDPKPPWQERKEDYIAHIVEASESVCRVSLADKLHNARAILYDLREHGEMLWDRFRGGKDGTLWYYRALVEAFKKVHSSPQVDEFERVVAEIAGMAE